MEMVRECINHAKLERLGFTHVEERQHRTEHHYYNLSIYNGTLCLTPSERSDGYSCIFYWQGFIYWFVDLLYLEDLKALISELKKKELEELEEQIKAFEERDAGLMHLYESMIDSAPRMEMELSDGINVGLQVDKERLDDILIQHKELEDKIKELLKAPMEAFSNAWPKFIANRLLQTNRTKTSPGGYELGNTTE